RTGPPPLPRNPPQPKTARRNPKATPPPTPMAAAPSTAPPPAALGATPAFSCRSGRVAMPHSYPRLVPRPRLRPRLRHWVPPRPLSDRALFPTLSPLRLIGMVVV